MLFFVKHEAADEMRISDWSSDVCSSDLGMVGAPACGDVMKLQIKVSESGVIEDARFKTYGCGSAIASSSLVTEWVKGKTLDEALNIRNTQIAEDLSLTPAKINCANFAGSEEPTSELPPLMRTSYAVFCLKTKIQ